jgi:hypothetical protein
MHLIHAPNSEQAHKKAREQHTALLVDRYGQEKLRRDLDVHKNKCQHDSEQARNVMKQVLQVSSDKQSGKPDGWWQEYEDYVKQMRDIGIRVNLATKTS